MNIDPKQTINERGYPPRRKSRALLYSVVTALVMGGAGVGAWAVWGMDSGAEKIAPGDIHVVKRGPLTISISQGGTIHHRDKVIVKSKLEGYSTVIWITEEGKRVKKDDLLLELDASGFEQKKEQQDIVVINSEANLVSATEALNVTRNDAKTAIDDAKLAIELAELDLKKYVGSEYFVHINKEIEDQLAEEARQQTAAGRAPTTRPATARPAKSPGPAEATPAEISKDDSAKAVELAELELKKYVGGEYHQLLEEGVAQINIVKQEELERAKERVAWSKKLYDQGYLTLTELQADELAAKRAELDLSTAKSKLFLLLRYTHVKTLAGLRNSLVKVRRALNPIQRKGAADIRQAEAKLKARESEHKQQVLLLAKAESQIKECKVYAPVGGEVVYATTTSSRHRHGSSTEALKEGSTVRERQELFHMPGQDKIMMAVTSIPQASRNKVIDPETKLLRHLPARITIDEVKDKDFLGTLAKMAPMPSQADWYQSSKVFATEVHVNEVDNDLRPGYSCNVEIIVAQYEDVLSIPLQAVHKVKGKPTVYVIIDNKPQPRAVEVGLDNNRMVHIKSGLEEGDKVLLSPPLGEAEVDPREVNGADDGADDDADDDAPDADNGATTRPASKGKGGGMGSMTPEQRKEMFEKMTPEQRKAYIKRMREARGSGDGAAPPRGRPRSRPAGARNRPAGRGATSQ